MTIFTPNALKDQALFSLSGARLGGMKRAGEAGGSKTDAELKALASEFEAVFVQYLQKSMRATVPKSGLFSSFSLDMYESMFDQQLASEVSLKKGLGLADVIYKDLKRIDLAIRRANEMQAAMPQTIAMPGEP